MIIWFSYLIDSNPLSSLIFFDTKIDEMVAVISESSEIPANITTIATMRPPKVIGLISPYPTVNTVTKAHHIESQKLVYSEGFVFFSKCNTSIEARSVNSKKIIKTFTIGFLKMDFNTSVTFKTLSYPVLFNISQKDFTQIGSESQLLVKVKY